MTNAQSAESKTKTHERSLAVDTFTWNQSDANRPETHLVFEGPILSHAWPIDICEFTTLKKPLDPQIYASRKRVLFSLEKRFWRKMDKGVWRAEPQFSPSPFCSAELPCGYGLMAACTSQPSLFQTGVYAVAQPPTLHLRGRENRWTCLCLYRFSG